MRQKKHMFDVRTPGGKVRSATIRKSAKDGSLTATEKLTKNRLMKQFSARAKGYAVAVSQAYRDGWDYCFGKKDE